MKNKKKMKRVYYALRYGEELRMEIPFWIATFLGEFRKALRSFADATPEL